MESILIVNITLLPVILKSHSRKKLIPPLTFAPILARISDCAGNIAKSAAAARETFAETLGALPRIVSSAFHDLRQGNWHIDQNDDPNDHIEHAMLWAEALVRRVIRSLVAELRQAWETTRLFP